MGLPGSPSKREGTKRREEEIKKWGSDLGIKPEQIHFFRADKTYEGRGNVHKEDQRRMVDLIKKEKPTMVFLPPLIDTAQRINVNSRKMVVNALNQWLKEDHKKAGRKRTVYLLEYPTNHVPFLPPSDRNLDIDYSGTEIPWIKKKSMGKLNADKAGATWVLVNTLERIDGIIKVSDKNSDLRRVRRFFDGREPGKELSKTERERDIMGAYLEHFGVTKLSVKEKSGVPIIVEERVKFPLKGVDKRRWFKKPKVKPRSMSGG